jgi:hypothetical protein
MMNISWKEYTIHNSKFQDEYPSYFLGWLYLSTPDTIRQLLPQVQFYPALVLLYLSISGTIRQLFYLRYSSNLRLA